MAVTNIPTSGTAVGAQEAPLAPTTASLRVQWGAVFAGAILATSLSFVFLTFGSAVGLSLTSAWPNSGLSAGWTATLAAFWILAQQIGAFLAGGYIAGRIRGSEPDTPADEIEFRDGLHGSLVWAVSIAIGALLAASAATVVARTGAEAGASAISAAPRMSEQVGYFADVILRPAAAQPGQPSPAAARATQNPAALSQPVRQELGRILARSAVNRQLSQADRNYLATLVARETGLSADDAQTRVTDTFNELARSVRESADKARHAAALGGFITAAGILIGFAAAWWGAIRGGQHRDNNFTHTGLYLRTRRTSTRRSTDI